jgi:hypothetical protein
MFEGFSGENVMVVFTDFAGKHHRKWMEPVEAVQAVLCGKENGIRWFSARILWDDDNARNFDQSFIETPVLY